MDLRNRLVPIRINAEGENLMALESAGFMDHVHEQSHGSITFPSIPLRTLISACVVWYSVAMAHIGYRYLIAVAPMGESIVNVIIVTLGPVLVAWIVARSKSKDEQIASLTHRVIELTEKAKTTTKSYDDLRAKLRRDGLD